MGISSKMAHKESEVNKAELRARQQQPEELRAMCEKKQEEMKVQVGQCRNHRQVAGPLTATEEPRPPFLSWKLQ